MWCAPLSALPLDFFQKRKLGDLLQRFRSLEPIKQFIVSGGITTLVDGLLAGVTFILMMLYSESLTLLSLAVVLCYATLRVVVRTIARQRSPKISPSSIGHMMSPKSENPRGKRRSTRRSWRCPCSRGTVDALSTRLREDS